LSDDEFADELRRHLQDRSWTLDHWIELEYRGDASIEHDSELRDAIVDERRQLNESIKKALSPVYENLSRQLEPLQERLRELVASVAPKVDLSVKLPTVDISRLTSAAYRQFNVEPLLPSPSGQGPLAIAGYSHESVESVLGDLAEVQAERLEEEAEVRRAHLETATASVAQLQTLEEVRDAVVRSGKRGWYDWLLLSLTAIAAVAAVAAAWLAAID
jgi:hypothetical protein